MTEKKLDLYRREQIFILVMQLTSVPTGNSKLSIILKAGQEPHLRVKNNLPNFCPISLLKSGMEDLVPMY